jgi:hypothetical protein
MKILTMIKKAKELKQLTSNYEKYKNRRIAIGKILKYKPISKLLKFTKKEKIIFKDCILVQPLKLKTTK